MCKVKDIILFVLMILIINSIDTYIDKGYLILGITHFINLCIIAVGFILNKRA